MVSAKSMIEKPITSFPFLIQDLIPKVGLVALAGSSDTGKSSFLRDLALTIVETKDSFLGLKIQDNSNSVLYVSTEDDNDAINYFLNKQLGKVDAAEYENLYFIFKVGNLLKELDQYLSKTPASLVIIDAYTDIFTGDINSSNSVRNFLKGYSDLAQKHSCCILFLHHFGKGRSEEKGSKHSFLGSQGFEAKMRVALTLTKNSSNNNCRNLEVVKGNYLKQEIKDEVKVLEFRDNMRFSLKNHFTRSSNTSIKKSKEKEEVIKLVSELHNESRTWDEIAAAVKEAGYTFAKSTIHKWFKESNTDLTIQSN